MRGFDRSRVDVGAIESNVTTEQTIRFDEDGLASGSASGDVFEILVDAALVSIDPPHSRIGSVMQAIQSEVWAALELATNDIERQWHLRRAQDLQRFCDWLRVRARSSSREDLRRRLYDVMIAYQDSGSERALRRVAGAYTGQAPFITRTDRYPGYWTVGSSYVTPKHLFVPARPLGDAIEIRETSGAHPVGQLAVLSIEVSAENIVKARWKAPGESFGPVRRVRGIDVIQIGSSDPDHFVRLKVDADLVRTLIPLGTERLFTIAVMAAPDACQDHENWVPGWRNLRHGVWLETFGHSTLDDDIVAEMEDRIRDVADLAPLNRRSHALEQPTFMAVPEELGWFWDRTYAGVETFEPTFVVPFGAGFAVDGGASGGGSGDVSGGGASGFGWSGLAVAVPFCRGPFVAIKERFNEFEHPAEATNFELGSTFTWEIRDEIVSQPDTISGVQIIQVDASVPTGRGYLSFDPVADQLIWQAPGDGPDDLDPLGSGATLDGASVAVDPPQDITGITLQNASPSTPVGVGTLRYDAVGGTLSWQAPTDAAGAAILIPGVSESLVTLTSADVSFSVQARIVLSALPASSVEENLGVRASFSIPGVTIVGVTARTRVGDGRVSFVPAAGMNPATLTWEPPSGAVGPEVIVDGDGSYVLPDADGLSMLYITINVSSLPTTEAIAELGVSGATIGNAREVILRSGNGLYPIRVRVLGTQLPGGWTSDPIRVRTAELITAPVTIPDGSTGSIEVSILDRPFAESVRRRAWTRTSATPGDPWSDWSVCRSQDIVPVRAGDAWVEIRVRIEPDESFVGFPHVDQYDLVAITLRPRGTSRTDGCCAEDDALRFVTGGLLAACGRQTDLGIVTGGLLGYLSTVYCDADVPPVEAPDPKNPAPSP